MQSFYPMSALMGLVYLSTDRVVPCRPADPRVPGEFDHDAMAGICTIVLAVPFLGDGIAVYQLVALLIIVGCIYALALARLRKTA